MTAVAARPDLLDRSLGAERLGAAVRDSRPRDVFDLVGGTPLIDLSRLGNHLGVGPGVRLYAKAEHLNPGGSVKDRPALGMVRDAVRRGLLEPGNLSAPRILDATSGNTGIAYAMIGAAFGIGVTLCLPANVSPERKTILEAYGVDVRLTDPLEASDGAIHEARRIAADDSGRFVYLDQYSNPENWRAHYRTTGPEIWSQTGGRLSHFITGLGTSGTFTGVGRFLRRKAPKVRLISVEPDGPLHGLEGLKHMASALAPAIYDPVLADERRTLATEEAYSMIRILARQTGLLVGPSAAANVSAAIDLARELESGTVVTVLCDDAGKYFSQSFWKESP